MQFPSTKAAATRRGGEAPWPRQANRVSRARYADQRGPSRRSNKEAALGEIYLTAAAWAAFGAWAAAAFINAAGGVG